MFIWRFRSDLETESPELVMRQPGLPPPVCLSRVCVGEASLPSFLGTLAIRFFAESLRQVEARPYLFLMRGGTPILLLRCSQRGGPPPGTSTRDCHQRSGRPRANMTS